MFKMKYKLESNGDWFTIVKRRFFWQEWEYEGPSFTNKDHTQKWMSEL